MPGNCSREQRFPRLHRHPGSHFRTTLYDLSGRIRGFDSFGQPDPEDRALAGFAVHFDNSLVRFHGPLRDRKAKSSPAFRSGSRRVDPVEPFEDAAPVFFRNPGTPILDLYEGTQ